jgi:hypothetical protein
MMMMLKEKDNRRTARMLLLLNPSDTTEIDDLPLKILVARRLRDERTPVGTVADMHAGVVRGT